MALEVTFSPRKIPSESKGRPQRPTASAEREGKYLESRRRPTDRLKAWRRSKEGKAGKGRNGQRRKSREGMGKE